MDLEPIRPEAVSKSAIYGRLLSLAALGWALAIFLPKIHLPEIHGWVWIPFIVAIPVLFLVAGLGMFSFMGRAGRWEGAITEVVGKDIEKAAQATPFPKVTAWILKALIFALYLPWILAFTGSRD